MTLSGFLTKRDSTEAGYRKRWIVLSDSQIRFYNSKRDHEAGIPPKSQYKVVGIEAIVGADGSEDPLGFKVIGDNDCETIIRADTVQEKVIWKKELETICNQRLLSRVEEEEKGDPLLREQLKRLFTTRELSSIAFVTFKVDGLQLMRVSEEETGIFNDSDVYIVFNAEEHGRKLVHEVYTWVGKNAKMDLVTVGSLKALEIKKAIGGSCNTHREEQEEESPEFLKLFHGSVLVKSTASSAKRAVRTTNERWNEEGPRLFRVILLDESEQAAPQMDDEELDHNLDEEQLKRLLLEGDGGAWKQNSKKGKFTVCRVALTADERISDRVLVLDTRDKHIYLWCGNFSNFKLRGFGLETASYIRKENPKGASIIQVQEDEEPPEFTKYFDSRDPPDLLAGFEGRRRVLYKLEAQEQDDLYDDPRNKPTPKLQLSVVASTSFEPGFREADMIPAPVRRLGVPSSAVGPLLSMLAEDGAYILDCWTEVFVWIGKNADPFERVGAYKVAQQIIDAIDRPKWVKEITRLMQGQEPFLFRIKFPDWLGTVAPAKSAQPETFQKAVRTIANISTNQTKEQQVDGLLNTLLSTDDQLLQSLEKGEEPDSNFVAPSSAEEKVYAAGAEFDSGGGELLVWRVQKKGLISVPEEEFGHFQAHCSYVLLYGFDDDEETKNETDADGNPPTPRFLLYFWEGYRAQKSDYILWRMDIAKRTMPEWERVMGCKIPEIRVQQFDEPEHFLRMFSPGRGHGRYIVHDKIYRRRDANHERVSLYQVHSTSGNFCKAVQVPPSVSSLNTRDVFVCVKTVVQDGDAPNEDDSIWFWVGARSSLAVQEWGATVSMRLMEYFGLPASYQVELVEELELDGEHYDRWMAMSAALGGGSYKPTEPLPEDDLEDPPVVLYVQDFFKNHKLEFQPVINYTQAELKDTNICVLDAFSRVYIWVGKHADLNHQDMVLEATKKFMLKSGRQKSKLSIVHSGKEPSSFKSYFAGWDDNRLKLQLNEEYVDPYEARLERMRQEGTLGEIYQMRGRVLEPEEARQLWQQDTDLIQGAEQFVDPTAPEAVRTTKSSRTMYLHGLGDMSLRTAIRRGQGTDVVKRAEEKFEERKKMKRMAQREAEMRVDTAATRPRSGRISPRVSPRARSPRQFKLDDDTLSAHSMDNESQTTLSPLVSPAGRQLSDGHTKAKAEADVVSLSSAEDHDDLDGLDERKSLELIREEVESEDEDDRVRRDSYGDTLSDSSSSSIPERRDSRHRAADKSLGGDDRSELSVDLQGHREDIPDDERQAGKADGGEEEGIDEEYLAAVADLNADLEPEQAGKAMSRAASFAADKAEQLWDPAKGPGHPLLGTHGYTDVSEHGRRRLAFPPYDYEEYRRRLKTLWGEEKPYYWVEEEEVASESSTSLPSKHTLSSLSTETLFSVYSSDASRETMKTAATIWPLKPTFRILCEPEYEPPPIVDEKAEQAKQREVRSKMLKAFVQNISHERGYLNLDANSEKQAWLSLNSYHDQILPTLVKKSYAM